MRQTIIFLIAGLMIFISFGVCGALLIENDWKYDDDGFLTYDSNTGLDWLDLTQTENRSYTEVVSQLSIDGTYAGFRFATNREVYDLFQNAGFGPPSAGIDFYHSNEKSVWDKTERIQELLGHSDSEFNNYAGGQNGTWGLTDGEFCPPEFCGNVRNSVTIERYLVNDEYFSVMAADGGFNAVEIDTRSKILASFLVRNHKAIPIPEPATIILLGVGLTSVLGSAIRRYR